MALVAFHNKGASLAQTTNSKEIAVGGAQYARLGKVRPMLNLRQFYLQANGKTFPHSSGLLNPTSASLKKYVEHIYG